ncbi:MAG: hypothetical protein LAP13_07465 [Acidobacteriia bacterium]|nr:hypothetical protein [Terriglobia bacterium]
MLLRIHWRMVLGLAGLALLIGPSLARAAGIKLFLKDGTYQLVSSYEVQGDRVRYYSLERSDWEEIPAALVDLETTKRTAQEVQVEKKKQLEAAHDLAAERFEKPAEMGYQVAPGIHLPPTEGIYALDGARVIHLLQASGEVVTDKKRAALLLAMPLPVMKSRSFVILHGAQAAVRVPGPQPVFYVQSADGLGAKLALIPLKSGKEARVVEKLEARQTIIKSKATESRTAIPLQRVQVTPQVYKLTPTKALSPGEYALAELLEDKLNLEVWDFGIDKPAN